MWKVRVEELLLSDRALLLGHPMHSLSNRIWAKSEVRLARDCKGYTLLEFEAHYGENYEVHWNLGEPCSGGRHELARHGALLRLLKEHYIYRRGWRVLAHPSSQMPAPAEDQDMPDAHPIPCGRSRYARCQRGFAVESEACQIFYWSTGECGL